MAGNTIGEIFKVTTFGESHGKALGAIIDGCPPNISLDEAMIQKDLDRRKPGTSKFTSPRREADKVQILSGVFEGKTTGTPIGLIVFNDDQRSSDYDAIKNIFRPSHADFTYEKKYGIRDYRGGGRSSARETIMRVAAGAIARAYLREQYNILIDAYVSQIGTVKINEELNILDFLDFKETNPLFCPDETALGEMQDLIVDLKKQGDSTGAKVSLVIQNTPIGLGEPVFDRLDADLAHALMSINASKAVEIGAGFDCVSLKGSENRDEIDFDANKQARFLSNKAGGILGGISNGDLITANVAFKPTSSIKVAGKTIDKNNQQTDVITKGRHDPCVGIRAVPIVEAMAAIVLMDHLMRHKAQNGRI